MTYMDKVVLTIKKHSNDISVTDISVALYINIFYNILKLVVVILEREENEKNFIISTDFINKLHDSYACFCRVE